MTTFIVLAAGRGARMGRVGTALHKALVPLGREAVLSRLFTLRPPHSRVVIPIGYRGDQVVRYVRMAHPSLENLVTFAHVPNWDAPGAGPGASLLCALEDTDDDVVLTSCDTLWTHDPALWRHEGSWVGVAPVPAGTTPERWCRFAIDGDGRVREIFDKRPGDADLAYVGMARVAREDLATFRAHLSRGSPTAGELQVSAGLEALVQRGLRARRVAWTDVGDEEAYREAVRRVVGYDWTKPDQATFVLPYEGRVVKFFTDLEVASARADRAKQSTFLPVIVDREEDMFAYDYVNGVSGYLAVERDRDVIHQLLDQCARTLWVHVTPTDDPVERATRFYRGKTFARIDLLRPELRTRAVAAAARVDWDRLCAGVVPAIWHGDLNLGNIVVTQDQYGNRFTGIDWREDFAGTIDYGDLRYDLAKLHAGLTDVHWERAQRGDFTPLQNRSDVDACRSLRGWHAWDDTIPVLSALTLLNSAPLHEEPFDEVLVARGCARLEEAL